jgi:hypothetical protein
MFATRIGLIYRAMVILTESSTTTHIAPHLPEAALALSK